MKYLRRQFSRDLVADHARAAGVQKRLARSREPFEDRRDHERVLGVGAIDDGVRLARRVPHHAMAAQVTAHGLHAVGAQFGRGVLGAGEPGDGVSGLDERIGHGSSDVSGSAGHEYFHVCLNRSFIVRSTSSGSRFHQSSWEKISTSWKLEYPAASIRVLIDFKSITPSPIMPRS